MHAHEVYPHDTHARKMHAYERHAREMHTPVRYTPMRHPPIRCTLVGCMPVRYVLIFENSFVVLDAEPGDVSLNRRTKSYLSPSRKARDLPQDAHHSP